MKEEWRAPASVCCERLFLARGTDKAKVLFVTRHRNVNIVTASNEPKPEKKTTCQGAELRGVSAVG